MQEGKNVILCIDDDPDVLIPLKIILEAGGYAVATAPDAKEGILAFREAKPDLVILDLMMEEVDAGIRLVKEIQALDSKVPIYMLSSTGDYLHSTADISSLGLAGVFQKPVNARILLSLLRTKLKGQEPAS
jgi:DNA-binding response OmpR family regulator